MAKSRKQHRNGPRTGLIALAGMSRKRALTAQAALWQSLRCRPWHCALGAVAAACMVAAAPSAFARTARGGLDGPISTLHRGDYICEEEGDALGEAGIHQPAEDFSILHDSVYRTATGRGSYLFTGKLVVMTGGPKRGERFRSLSDGFLRRLAPDGTETTLRCIRQVLNNQH